MFAFCPGIDRYKCGLPTNSLDKEVTEYDFTLRARRAIPTTIKTDHLRYRDGAVDEREYDACHYMIISGR